MAGKIIQLVLSIGIIITGIRLLAADPDNWHFGGTLLVLGVGWLIAAIAAMSKKSRGADAFIKNLASVEDLPTPKTITITTSTIGSPIVSLNGETIGNVKSDKPLTFSVIKKRNVLAIAEGICFFEVTDTAGEGSLKAKTGLASLVVEIIESSGLKAFTPQ
jgi:hypothetical protein